MGQVDFAYAPAGETARMPAAVSIFADRAWLREELQDDALAAGLGLRESAEISALLEGEARPLGDVVLIDCPTVGGAALAALTRLDVRARRSGARLVISTRLAALDEIFACCDQSSPQILVDPSRADRAIALGRALADFATLRVRDLSKDDRLTLLRLTEQVGRIAERLKTFEEPAPAEEPAAFRFESPGRAYRSPPCDGLTKSARPPLPEPGLVRRIIRQRQLRSQFFDGALFADPAWDILLDLTAARAEHKQVSVTSLCIASGVPPTTALRWIGQMTEAGLLRRVEDETDRRRAFITLSDQAATALAGYFAELERNAKHLV